MLTWFSRRADSRSKASKLYGAVVAMARKPELFSDMGAADTAEGRYEVLVLQLFLVMERLRAEGSAGEPVARTLIEAFVTDMDDNMREMGVGDLTVPRKVKKAAAAFYDRAEALRPAFAQPGDEAIQKILLATIPATAGRTLDAAALAKHARGVAGLLKTQPLQVLLEGGAA